MRSTIRLFACLASLTVASCIPVAVKAKCEVMAKTDYQKVAPEQKCGGVVEVTLWSVK